MIKKCKICGKEINTRVERIATTKENQHWKTKTMCTSDEGVYFEEGICWFCNECWEELKND